MGSELISLSEARERIFNKLSPRNKTHWLSLRHAVSSILAEAIYAPVNVPGNDNSAMDGFAVRCLDLQKNKTLAISQRITAGKKALTLEAGTAARIFTGAMLPANADTVVIQENCDFDEAMVTVHQIDNISAGQNIRRAGQDIKKGGLVFPKGHRLSAQDIGLLASLGLEKVLSYSPLKIAVVSTGNELLAPGEPWQDGKIYNSNSFMLQALLENCGFEPDFCHALGDNFDELKKHFAELADTHDCIISTGGVSVGEEDYVKQVVQELGVIDLWRLALKPGKPLAFGEVAGKAFFGLPGNPVAVFVTYILLVKPALLCSQGMDKLFVQQQLDKSFFRIRADFEQQANKKRVEYLRVSQIAHPEYGQVLSLFDNQSSGVLSSVCQSDGLAIMEIGKAIHKGDWVTFLPFPMLQ